MSADHISKARKCSGPLFVLPVEATWSVRSISKVMHAHRSVANREHFSLSFTLASPARVSFCSRSCRRVFYGTPRAVFFVALLVSCSFFFCGAGDSTGSSCGRDAAVLEEGCDVDCTTSQKLIRKEGSGRQVRGPDLYHPQLGEHAEYVGEGKVKNALWGTWCCRRQWLQKELRVFSKFSEQARMPCSRCSRVCTSISSSALILDATNGGGIFTTVAMTLDLMCSDVTGTQSEGRRQRCVLGSVTDKELHRAPSSRISSKA